MPCSLQINQKPGYKSQINNIKTQKIDRSIYKKFIIILIKSQIEDNLRKVHFSKSFFSD